MCVRTNFLIFLALLYPFRFIRSFFRIFNNLSGSFFFSWKCAKSFIFQMSLGSNFIIFDTWLGSNIRFQDQILGSTIRLLGQISNFGVKYQNLESNIRFWGSNFIIFDTWLGSNIRFRVQILGSNIRFWGQLSDYWVKYQILGVKFHNFWHVMGKIWTKKNEPKYKNMPE